MLLHVPHRKMFRLWKITKEILESFEQPTQMKIQKQFITKLAENLDDMNTECIKLKSIIKKKLKPKA